MKNKLRELAEFKGIVVPEGGWKGHTVYLVRVCWNKGNPVYRALLHTGFLNKNNTEFAGYCAVWCNTMDEEQAGRAYYLEVEQELCRLP